VNSAGKNFGIKIAWYAAPAVQAAHAQAADKRRVQEGVKPESSPK
jgi:hypothetical protein